MKKRLFALALAALLLLSACSAMNEADLMRQESKAIAPGGAASPTMAAATTSPAMDMNFNLAPSSSIKGESESYAPSAAPGSGTVTESALAAQEIGRKLIRTGYYSLETMDYAKTIQQIEELVNTMGGYIQHSSTSGDGAIKQAYANPRYARYVVRVPAEGFFSFAEALSEYATIISSSQNTEEVTDYYYDTDARLKTLRVQEERLLALMSQATALEAIIMLEQSLGDVRYQIESQEGTLRRLDSQISFSTINIDVSEVFTPTKIEPVPVTLGQRIASRFGNTLEDMRRGAENALVVILGDAPQILLTLALVAVIVLAALAIYRKTRAKINAGKSESAAKPGTEKKEDEYTSE